jgi:hypothetical protein
MWCPSYPWQCGPCICSVLDALPYLTLLDAMFCLPTCRVDALFRVLFYASSFRYYPLSVNMTLELPFMQLQPPTVSSRLVGINIKQLLKPSSATISLPLCSFVRDPKLLLQHQIDRLRCEH